LRQSLFSHQQKVFFSTALQSFKIAIDYRGHLNTGVTMEQQALKNVNNCLNTNIYSDLVTSGGKR
jgi:hypothetical protein